MNNSRWNRTSVPRTSSVWQDLNLSPRGQKYRSSTTKPTSSTDGYDLILLTHPLMDHYSNGPRTMRRADDQEEDVEIVLTSSNELTCDEPLLGNPASADRCDGPQYSELEDVNFIKGSHIECGQCWSGENSRPLSQSIGLVTRNSQMAYRHSDQENTMYSRTRPGCTI